MPCSSECPDKTKAAVHSVGHLLIYALFYYLILLITENISSFLIGVSPTLFLNNLNRRPVSSMDKGQSAEREAVGLNPGRTNTQSLYLTEEKVLPL